MPKYNVFDELLSQLCEGRQRNIAAFIEEIQKLLSDKGKQIGNKFVTHLEKNNINIENDKKVLDVVQDADGNLLWFRSVLYTKDNKRLSTFRVSPDFKDLTIYDTNSGKRITRGYNDTIDHPTRIFNSRGTGSSEILFFM